jgi:hypothetical protein
MHASLEHRHHRNLHVKTVTSRNGRFLRVPHLQSMLSQSILRLRVRLEARWLSLRRDLFEFLNSSFQKLQ